MSGQRNFSMLSNWVTYEWFSLPEKYTDTIIKQIFQNQGKFGFNLASASGPGYRDKTKQNNRFDANIGNQNKTIFSY